MSGNVRRCGEVHNRFDSQELGAHDRIWIGCSFAIEKQRNRLEKEKISIFAAEILIHLKTNPFSVEKQVCVVELDSYFMTEKLPGPGVVAVFVRIFLISLE